MNKIQMFKFCHSSEHSVVFGQEKKYAQKLYNRPENESVRKWCVYFITVHSSRKFFMVKQMLNFDIKSTLKRST